MDPPEDETFYALLRQLKDLRVVGADTWKSTALPVLQSLTNITAVYGGWGLGQGVDFGGLVCPHIREHKSMVQQEGLSLGRCFPTLPA
jgi:hypothetical protein